MKGPLIFQCLSSDLILFILVLFVVVNVVHTFQPSSSLAVNTYIAILLTEVRVDQVIQISH